MIQLEREPLVARLSQRLRVEQEAERSGKSFRRHPHREALEDWFLKPVLKAALIPTGLYGRGQRNALRPVVTRVAIEFPDLPPAFDGYRILHLADLHIDALPELTPVVAKELSHLHADICLMTGDYRCDIKGSCEPAMRGMKEALACVPCPVVATLGNHDSCEMGTLLQDIGIEILINEAIEIAHRGDSIWVAGLDDSYDYRCDDVESAVSGVPQDAFCIMMAHTPDLYGSAAAAGSDLYLCGHTHGGQIRLPWIGPVISNSDAPRAYKRGYWKHGFMHGYTSSGIGCSMLPIRFNCPPEIVLIELRKAR